jgi:hypothetical protein
MASKRQTPNWWTDPGLTELNIGSFPYIAKGLETTIYGKERLWQKKLK